MERMSAFDEKELLAALRGGDPTAFSSIFHRFHSSLVFFAERILTGYDITEAEETVQDTFIKLYDRKEAFDTLQNIKAFLYITTKNACYDRIAKEKVRRKRFDSYIATFEEADDHILREITYAEVIREVSMAIDLLPEKCRVIMKQFFDEDKTAKEIADDLDITVSTVNNQKARAVVLLKKRLSGAGIALLLLSL
ncbi:sigma-70 family RNA polymerase sigma factor [Flavobacterium dauae]|uniref:RNA polymerase sigma factor n=1 Tax=Flavobacterium dauae TaxID=1563479 RepID=UPI00101B30B6|nr:sigma-70 family RNA polymerase sigma factor [Flavobacterium dauae]WLD24337.1 sigma-70 family RNA polymerase sigma factor [Flavobacterium dauae]